MSVEGQMLVHLVGGDQNVMSTGKAGDDLELGGSEDLAGRIVGS